MKKDTYISTEQKAQIKAEEIYRAEIRKEINTSDQNQFLNLLNSPLGIWLLSFVFLYVGGFLFKRWYESISTKKENQRIKYEMEEEINYRCNQVDEAYNKCFLIVEKIENDLSSGNDIYGSSIKELLQRVSLINIVSSLGGLSTFPPSEEEKTIQIGFSGFSSRQLPFGRGYQNPKFKHTSLVNILKSYCKINNPKYDIESFTEEIVNYYQNTALTHEPLHKDWFDREQARGQYGEVYENAYSIYNIPVDDMNNDLKNIINWHKASKNQWLQLKMKIEGLIS